MRVGADIKAGCRKCGEVWHVIIAMTGRQIAKVECGDCGARHGYRAAGGATSRRSTATRKRGASKSAEPIVEADLSRPRRSFQTSETYQIGDRLIHATFGEGVVQTLIGNGKLTVLFGVGIKTMVHGRTSS